MEENIREIYMKSVQKFREDSSLIAYRREISFIDFLSEYTLHDSYLELIIADQEYYFTIGIEWDSFWNKDKLQLREEDSNEWPYLFISFPNLYKINWTMLQGDTTDTILETSSQLIELDMLEEKLKKSITLINKNLNKKQITLVETHFSCLNGEIEILHEDPIEIFCIDKNGNLIKL